MSSRTINATSKYTLHMKSNEVTTNRGKINLETTSIRLVTKTKHKIRAANIPSEYEKFHSDVRQGKSKNSKKKALRAFTPTYYKHN